MSAADLSFDRWITDTETSSRLPHYTRANADEVGPDPFTPLGWSLGWAKGCVPGVAQGFINFGAVAAGEFVVDPPEVFGNWGGYFYNQLSLGRVMGCRMPGASPAAIDQAYFGDHPGVPPYIAHPDDENETQTAILGEKMAWVMSTDTFPAMDEGAALARKVVTDRPDFSTLTEAELVAYGRAMAPIIDEVWTAYCEVCVAASLGPGAVQAICAALGRPDDAVKVLAGVGGIESADTSFLMWDLSRIVRRSPQLMALFDAGVDGLMDRLAGLQGADADELRAAWSRLIAEYGHRGPNEWDMGAESWTTKPELALSMLERLRHQDDARSPYVARQHAAAERERVLSELDAALAGDPDTQAMLKAAAHSAQVFFGLRERGKNACIRVIHEGKLAFRELGRRMVAKGALGDPADIFMLLDEELDRYLADPASFRGLLEQRAVQFRHLHELEPPYIVSHGEGVPPISTWPKRGSATATKAVGGEKLQGASGAPGVVTGVARVVLDPSDPAALEPGDIMIAPTTDPSWTPLFLAAGGVVVNVGAMASHAAIVCRELGVPCAVSVIDATLRIPDGATITVDGSSGTVTIDSLA